MNINNESDPEVLISGAMSRIDLVLGELTPKEQLRILTSLLAARVVKDSLNLKEVVHGLNSNIDTLRTGTTMPLSNKKDVFVPERTAKERIEEIDSSISLRGIYAKLSPPIEMHGQVIVDSFFPDYTSYPRGSVSWETRKNSDLDERFYIVWQAMRQLYYENLDNPNKEDPIYLKHFFAKLPLKSNPELSAVSMFFAHKYNDWKGRPGLFMGCYYVMPTIFAEELEKLIRDEPSNAEVFFQTASSGLEEKDGHPGIQRIRSDEIIILDLMELIPEKMFYSNNGSRRRMSAEVVDTLKLDLSKSTPSGMIRLPYNTSFGNFPGYN